MKTAFILLPLLLLTFSACNRTAEILEPTAEDLRIARQAIPVNEVLLMLRAGYKEPQVLNDIRARHIPATIDAATEEKFSGSGASPALIAALKNKENALTEVQRIAFEKYHAEKMSVADQSAQARQLQAYEQEREEKKEMNRRRSLAQQNYQNVSQNQRKEVAYDVAQRNYEAQRKSLEQNIVSLEAQINYQRRHHYTEAELAASNTTLESYRQQLRNLTPPLR